MAQHEVPKVRGHTALERAQFAIGEITFDNAEVKALTEVRVTVSFSSSATGKLIGSCISSWDIVLNSPLGIPLQRALLPGIR